MYIEADMQDKIHEFFPANAGTSTAEQSQTYFNIAELERYLEQPQYRSSPREIT
jgi:hypothetical protein